MNSSRRTGLLLVLVFIVSLPAVTQRIYAADEIEYYSFLRSLWFDRDLSFDNEYAHFADQAGPRLPGFRETFLAETTPTGHRRTFATIGCAVLWAPFYAIADAGVRVARLFGASVAADGYSRPYVAAVAYGSAVYGFLALMLAAGASLRIFGGREDAAAALRDQVSNAVASTWIAVAAVWLGTPLLFYMYVAPPFSHAASAFAVAAFIVTWLRVRTRWSPAGMAALGALAALVAMVREQDALFVAGVGLDFAWTLAERLRARERVRDVARLAGAAAVGVVTAAIAYLPQAVSYAVLNGGLRPSPNVTRKMTWTSPHAWQVLVSPQYGFLFWTPLALLALVGLVVMAVSRPAPGETQPVPRNGHLAAIDRRRIAICLLVMVALQVYIGGSIESWTVAGAFGQRRFVGLTLVLVVGLAALLGSIRLRAWRRVALAAVVVAVWWNVALMVEFATGLMNRQRLAPADNAYNAFVVVPREIPRIVYRYVFDRSSFYAPKR